MRDLQDVILAPIVTEKATAAQTDRNVFTFLVRKDANKAEIAQAVQAAWDVAVEDVRTSRYRVKGRRALMGRFTRRPTAGQRTEVKKAMVRLADGDHIEFYEVG
jgi:large subunit ribosomal protein L23